MQGNIYSLLALFIIFILRILLFSPIYSKIELVLNCAIKMQH